MSLAPEGFSFFLTLFIPLSKIFKVISILNNWDTDLLLAINGGHSSFWDFVMYYASNKFVWIPFYLTLLIFIARRHGVRTLEVLIFVALLITITDQVSVHCFKNIFMRLRPCQEVLIREQLHLVNGECGGMYGFVSSHAANTFALATFVGLLFFKYSWKVIAGMLLWAAFVSFSRVYLGVHYPLDVICGAALGVMIAFVIHAVFKWVFARNVFRFAERGYKGRS